MRPAVERLLAAIGGTGAAVTNVGLFVGRAAVALRVVAAGFRPAAVAPALRRLGWPGSHAAVGAFLRDVGPAATGVGLSVDPAAGTIPGVGHRAVHASTMDRAFTGVALLVERTPAFRPSGRRRPGLRLLRPWFAGAGGPLAFAAACGLLLLVPLLSTPILVTLLVDHALAVPQPPPRAGVFVGTAAVSAGLVYLLSWLQHRCLQRLTARLSVVQADRFVGRLFRLPVQFFLHRLAGDLMARVQAVGRVASQAAVQLLGIVVEIAVGAC